MIIDSRLKIGIIILSALFIISFMIYIIIKIFSKKKTKSKKIYHHQTVKQEFLDFNKSVKTYFKKRLNEKGELTYGEIKTKIKQPSIRKFCDKMDYYLYSGVDVSKEELKELKKGYRKALNNKIKPLKRTNKEFKLIKQEIKNSRSIEQAEMNIAKKISNIKE